jgi:uracil phosphoribosyltransferase
MSGVPQPTRKSVLCNERLRIVSAPLLSGLLARIRHRETPPAEFVRLVGAVGAALILEACRQSPTRIAQVPGFDGALIDVAEPDERIAAVVILRAGLVFAEPFRSLVPRGPIYQIGAHRDERTLEASIYTRNLPNHPGWADRVLLLDPMLATGRSAMVALSAIRHSHTGPLSVVSLVAAPIGVAAVLDADSECEIVTAALDDLLDESGYIRPGLGDAGDRTFGTFP